MTTRLWALRKIVQIQYIVRWFVSLIAIICTKIYDIKFAGEDGKVTRKCGDSNPASKDICRGYTAESNTDRNCKCVKDDYCNSVDIDALPKFCSGKTQCDFKNRRNAATTIGNCSLLGIILFFMTTTILLK